MTSSVYLGPYVTFRYRDTYIPVYGCTNSSCATGWDQRWPWDEEKRASCPECGSPWGESRLQVPDWIDPSKVIGKGVLLKLSSGLVPFYGVAEKGLSRSFFLEPDRSHHLDLNSLDPKAEIEWFVLRYEDALRKLRTVCLDVEVRWGLHVYRN